MNNLKSKKRNSKRILKITLNIIGIAFVSIIGLLQPVKYFNPDKGEFGRKVPFYKTLLDSPDDIIINATVLFFIVIIACCISFIRDKNK